MADGFQRNNDPKRRRYHYLKYKKLAGDVMETAKGFDDLLPAALYLRLALEDIAHQEFLYYLPLIPAKEFRRWKPKQLLNFLLENFNTGNRELQIEIAKEQGGEPIFSAAHTSVDINALNKAHQSLSSFLHAPNPLNESSLHNLQQRTNAALQFISKYDEQAWISPDEYSEPTLDVSCSCGCVDKYAVKYLEKQGSFRCSSCNTLFAISVPSLFTSSNTIYVKELTKEIEFKCVECDSKVVLDIYKSALDKNICCHKCDTKYDISISFRFSEVIT